jgi:type I restriction enzyme S subunit
MIEGLKPYAEYKDSGQKWLGDVPAHWEVLPNRAIFDEIKERNHPKEEMLSVTITRGIVRQKALLDDSSKKDSSNLNKCAYKLVQPDDLAYNKMRAWQGALGASNFRGIISPAYVVMRPKNGANPWFYHNLYRTPAFAKEAERWSYGITSDMWSLRPEHFKIISSILPPPNEQSAIVRFLDHANQKIDRFIRTKRKLIALLNEQKQAIIHQAVTQGINPDVALKPSGSIWFLEIPKSWDVVTMRRVIRAAIDGPHFSPQYQDIGIPFLSARNVRPDKWLLNNAKYISESNYKIFCQRVRPEIGDVLYTKGGTTGIARAVDLDFPFQVWVHIAVLKLDHQLIAPEFLAFCLNSPRCYEQAQLLTRGATNQDLGLGRMKQIELPLPPTITEQTEIVSWLKGQLKTFNTAIARTEKEIALMQEYRTRLTADIVTGKLDVREAAAKLPDLSLASEAEFVADEMMEEIEAEEIEG